MGGYNQIEFLRSYKLNPQRAFRLLMDEYRDRIFLFSLRAASRKEDAEDLTQEVFIRTWKGLTNFRGDSKLTTWIYRIAWNVCASHLDKKGRTLDLLSYDETTDEEEKPGSYKISTEDIQFKTFESRQFIEELFTRIPEAHKLILTMYYLDLRGDSRSDRQTDGWS